jgi:hypothetical protein
VIRHPRQVPVVALLAAALALAAPDGAAEVAVGTVRIPLLAELEVRTSLGEERVPLSWEPGEDGVVAARAATSEWEAQVSLTPGPGGARAVLVLVRWLERAEVGRIALVLSWPGRPSAVGRSLRFAPLCGPSRVERGTPLLVAAGELLLAGGPGLAAARLVPSGGGVRATLLLDDALARPFTTFETCFDRLPTPAAGQSRLAWGSFDPRRDHPFAPRAKGAVDQLSAGLFPVAEGAPLLPVVLERWPAGARAAVVITDHADRTDPEALRAVLFGSSDQAERGGGILGRGLRITRTFFVHGHGGTLDDPRVQALADDLQAAGSEVALHSITCEKDTREAVRAGLKDAARWSPVTWIDHEPYTNCEAFSAQGWQDEGPYAIRDLLAKAGYRWVWAAGDEGKGQPRIDDLLGGGKPDEARAAIAPFPLDDRLWTFRSSMFYARPEVLAAALSEGELAALEDADGLFVAHTYLGASVHTTHTPDHLARLAVRAAPGGGLVIDPALDGALVRLSEHVRAGRLASLTWAEAGDRLRALGEVQVTYLPDGAAEIWNHGDTRLAGLTVAVKVAPEVELTVDGAPPAGRDDADGRARIWFDLSPGGRAVLRAFDRLVPLPFVQFP